MIKVHRINHAVDYEIPYQIFVDGKSVLVIHTNERLDYSVTPGKHTICVKSSKYRSNKITFTIDQNEIVEFEIKPDYKNNVLSKLITNTLFFKIGIKISKVESFYL